MENGFGGDARVNSQWCSVLGVILGQGWATDINKQLKLDKLLAATFSCWYGQLPDLRQVLNSDHDVRLLLENGYHLRCQSVPNAGLD